METYQVLVPLVEPPARALRGAEAPLTVGLHCPAASFLKENQPRMIGASASRWGARCCAILQKDEVHFWLRPTPDADVVSGRTDAPVATDRARLAIRTTIFSIGKVVSSKFFSPSEINVHGRLGVAAENAGPVFHVFNDVWVLAGRGTPLSRR